MARARWIGGLVALVMAATAVTPAQAAAFPDVIPLPDGFFPEGIEAGRGHTAYVGSLSSGAIVEVDLRTGAVETLAAGTGAGFSTVGLSFDGRTGLLYVAGGPTGTARVVDTSTGAVVLDLPFGGGFVNDVVVTREAAWFTDSFLSILHRVDLAPDGTPTGGFTSIPMAGFPVVPGQFNANGIVATPDGGELIVVNSSLGELFRVDPATGAAAEIELDGFDVANGDGLVLVGGTLYVVANFTNQILELDLAPDLSSAELVDVITDPEFDIPATAAAFGSSLYAVNARFTTPPGPDVAYDIVRVDR